MQISSCSTTIDSASLQTTAIDSDWFGEAFHPPVSFAFGIDADTFHFIASHARTALCHPMSALGRFQAELWKYDVAEFFLTDPVTGHYLEFNLSPDGGWWTCEFGAPLERIHAEDRPVPGVRTESRSDSQGWEAQAAVPLSWLREHLHFGPASRLNATIILGSPAQRFLSAHPLGSGQPAFHRPDRFPPHSIVSVP
jgi:hypothetical protein